MFNLDIEKDLSCVLVIFGGTGDLTHRKLVPAIYNLRYNDMLPKNFALVSVGRREMSHEDYRAAIKESVKNFSRNDFEEDKWQDIEKRLFYKKFEFSDNEGYKDLNSFLNKLDEEYDTKGNRIFYLAVAPEFFGLITEKFHSENMAENKDSWQRVVIEKPFGRNLESAIALNKQITKVFSEENTYRIDHYLGKEMIQSIMVLRFANRLFEPLWNNKYIDNIQISSSEIVGVENRGGYYERSGALKDMVQNHMLQLLTLIAMEPPVNLSSESIRDEKVKVLRSLEEFTPELVKSNIVRGQYGPAKFRGKHFLGYKQEERVSPDSDVETFVALEAHIQNYRWSGVPFYIRTGKRMKTKSTEIIVQFKDLPEILYFKEQGTLEPNLLIIKIQPKEGIVLQFNTKKPGTGNTIIPVQMDFCQNCQVESNSPEAYERLIYDVMKGDSTLFTSWNELEYSWKFVDTISRVWQQDKPDFPSYASFTFGPESSDELLEKNNNKWWNL